MPRSGGAFLCERGRPVCCSTRPLLPRGERQVHLALFYDAQLDIGAIEEAKAQFQKELGRLEGLGEAGRGAGRIMINFWEGVSSLWVSAGQGSDG
jgi:hypothetical protein